jgi:NitT/TauT family transport system permease protein
VLLGIWYGLSQRAGNVVIPTPGAVLAVLLQPLAAPTPLAAPSLFWCALVSLLRIVVGFSLAALLAVPLGLAMGRLRWVHQGLSPLVTMVRVICPLAWMPLAIVLLGSDSLAVWIWGAREGWRHEAIHTLQPAMLAIIGLAAFAPILLASAHAAAGVRSSWIEAAQLMGASRWRILSRVVLPASLPGIVNGMRIGLGIAWMVIVAAELLPGVEAGLGHLIWLSHDAAEYRYTGAAIIVIGVIGLAINGLLAWFEQRCGHWMHRQ